MPEEIDNCVQSILDDNPDMDKSTAFAICQDMQNRGVLADYNEAGETKSMRSLAEFREAGDIQRVEDGNTVVYKRVMLLSPGVWTDAGSEMTVDYSADGIRASAENFVDLESVQAAIPDWQRLNNEQRAQALANAGDDVLADAIPLNFLHGPSMYDAESLDDIGSIPTDSIIVDDSGRLYGDLHLSTDTAQGETAIDLMDEVLEAAQDPNAKTPPVGPSVEIPADRVDETDDAMLELQEAWISGVGIVFNPASRPVELGTQAQSRAIAMSAADSDTTGIVIRQLAEHRVHRPGFTGTITGAPDGFPQMDDFDTDSLDEISDHAIASTSGFPPDDFDDLLGFVVTTDGDLSLPLIQETAASIRQAQLGDESTFMARLSDEHLEEAATILNDIVAANFGDVVDDNDGVEDDPDQDQNQDGGDDGQAANQAQLSRAIELHKQASMLLSAARRSEDMGDLDATLDDLERTLQDIARELQEFDIEVADAQEAIAAEIEQRASEDMSEDEVRAEIVDELASTANRDEDTINAIIDGDIDTVPDEVASAMAEVLGVDMESLGSDIDEENEDNEADMADLQKVKETLGEFADHMGDIKDMLAAREDKREQTLEELERRLSEIESEPNHRSLSGTQSVDDAEFMDLNDDEVDDAPSGSPML